MRDAPIAVIKNTTSLLVLSRLQTSIPGKLVVKKTTNIRGNAPRNPEELSVTPKNESKSASKRTATYKRGMVILNPYFLSILIIKIAKESNLRAGF